MQTAVLISAAMPDAIHARSVFLVGGFDYCYRWRTRLRVCRPNRTESSLRQGLRHVANDKAWLSAARELLATLGSFCDLQETRLTLPCPDKTSAGVIKPIRKPPVDERSGLLAREASDHPTKTRSSAAQFPRFCTWVPKCLAAWTSLTNLLI